VVAPWITLKAAKGGASEIVGRGLLVPASGTAHGALSYVAARTTILFRKGSCYDTRWGASCRRSVPSVVLTNLRRPHERRRLPRPPTCRKLTISMSFADQQSGTSIT
jgi:hypothetical protein